MTNSDHDCCSSSTGDTGKDTPIEKSREYDLIVIGAGSAGFSAAITATEKGAQVALVGYGTIGGTCVNVGCVPSKTMIRAAETLYQARSSSRFNGIRASAGISSWQSIIEQKQSLVDDLRKSKYLDLLPDYQNVTYLEGKAVLTNGGVLVDGVLVRAKKIIVATGSSASIPPIEGIKKIPYLTSTTALALENLPASMIVVGGGVIGCELAQMFSRMGTQVSLLCRSRLLPSEEPEISEALENYLKDEGVNVVSGISYKSVSKQKSLIKKGRIILAYNRNGKSLDIKADHLMIATGRRANSKDLGLENMDIVLLPNGGIKVDDYMQTSHENIYAAGDVTGRDQFVYMAAYGAKIAAQNALEGNKNVYSNKTMPSVVFTDPQVASVGLTEDGAKKQGFDVKTSVLPLEYVPRALAARDTRGLIKLVADKATDKLLGAHIIAPEGADPIQTAALAISQGMTVDALGSMIFPYLTTVEGLKLAAQTFNKDVSKLSCCAG